jgi:hypothetical protein
MAKSIKGPGFRVRSIRATAALLRVIPASCPGRSYAERSEPMRLPAPAKQKPARPGRRAQFHPSHFANYTICVSKSRAVAKKNAAALPDGKHAWRKDLRFSKLPSRSAAAPTTRTLSPIGPRASATRGGAAQPRTGDARQLLRADRRSRRRTAGSQWLPDERVRDAREPYPPPAR